MNTDKHVCLLVPEYRTAVSPGGGVATVADFFASTIERFRPDWKLTIVSPRMSHSAAESRRLLSPGSWARGPIARRTTVNGRDVIYVGANLSEIEFFRFQARQALDASLHQADVVVAVAGSPATFNMIRRVKKPLVGQVATTAAAERKQSLRAGTWMARAARHATSAITSHLDERGIRVPREVLVENDVMREWSERRAYGRVQLIPPGVDLDLFRPGNPPSPYPFPYVLTVGRLDDPRKDPATLVKAFAAAIDSHNLPHHLVLAGNRPPDVSVTDLAVRLGIKNRVHLATRVSRADLVTLYQCADLFAMSSAEEGLGLVQIEALACGIPIVTTGTAGARFILGGSDAGIMVDLGDAVAERLGQAMATVLSDAGRYSKMRVSAEAVAERFSSERLGRQFIEILDFSTSRS